MPHGCPPTWNSVTFPLVVIMATLPIHSVNQRFPSGPLAMSIGWACFEIPAEYSVVRPAGVTFAMRSAVCSVTQMLPSGPAASAD